MFKREDELSELRQNVCRRESLKSTLAALEEERNALEKDLRKLKSAAEAEQVDVDRLEGFSLQNLFYGMTGQKEELLEKERREADVAWMEHDAAASRLAELNSQLERCNAERSALYDCEQAYWALLEEKLDSGCDPRPVAKEMAQRLEQIQSNLTGTIGQAIAAKEMGLNVLESLRTIDGFNEHLTGSLRANTVDSHLLGAKAKMDHFRQELADLNKELRDHDLTVFLFREDLLDLEPLRPEDFRSHSDIAERVRRTVAAVKDTRRKITEILDSLESISTRMLLRQMDLQKLTNP